MQKMSYTINLPIETECQQCNILICVVSEFMFECVHS